MSSDGYSGGWQETSPRGRRARRDSDDWSEEQGSYPPGDYYQEPGGYQGGEYSEPNGYSDGGWNRSVYQTDPRGRTDPGSYYDPQETHGPGEDYPGGSGYEGGNGYGGGNGYDGGYGPAGTYEGADPYADRQPYDDPQGYDRGGYDYRDDSYAGQPGYDQGAPYDDYTQAGSGPLRPYQEDDRYATADGAPPGWRGQQGGIGAPGDAGGGYEPTSRRERGYQRGAAGQGGPLGGSGRSGRMQADEDRHSGFFSGFPGDEDDDNYGRRRRRGVGAGTIALIVVVVVILGIGGAGYHFYSEYKSRHAQFSGSGFGSVEVIVQPGDSLDAIAGQLLSKGVIAAIDPWDAYVATKPDNLQPGEFRLHEHMSPAAAYALLLSPASKVDSTVTIIDGERESLILASLAKQTGLPLSQFQAAAKQTAALGLPSYANGSAEGYLYPDTYSYVPGSMTPLQILQTAVHQFNIQAGIVGLAAGAKKAEFTEAQVITEASLLEAEVGPKYYKDVARTLDNRLIINMPLELDSTVAYATGKYIYDLTSSDLRVNSPYNTFLHANLPPGPIDSPDAAAIEAVLNPAPSSDNWIYFVTVNKQGLTLFTNSNAQFQTWSQEAKNNGL
jgi:UPF0755 protein